jgi:hypothetical protein
MGRNHLYRSPAALVVIAALVASTACSPSGDSAAAARDRERSRAEWKLVLDDGRALPLERMDIYLTEEGYPNLFEIRGAGVTLVGTFPMGVTPDYEENFERLVGETITIEARGGDPREPKASAITLGGTVTAVSGGSFSVDRVSGKWQGSEGNKTLHGTIELHTPGGVLRGRFAVHAVTWG